MQDLNSEAEARALVQAIFPAEDARKAYLTIFADMVTMANEQNQENWAIKCTSDRIRLHVGPVIIATLVGNHIWCALDARMASGSSEIQALEQPGIWRSDERERYSRYVSIDSRNGHLRVQSEHDKIWQFIRPAHREAIRKASTARRKIHPATKRDHASGVLKYLRSALGQHVPDPLYK